MNKLILILLALIPGLLPAKTWQVNNPSELKAALKLSQANDQIISIACKIKSGGS